MGRMKMDLEDMEMPSLVRPGASPREVELEAKLSKRTLLMCVFAALSLTEFLVVIQLMRNAAG
jgi:hypothetical protein